MNQDAINTVNTVMNTGIDQLDGIFNAFFTQSFLDTQDIDTAKFVAGMMTLDYIKPRVETTIFVEIAQRMHSFLTS